MINPEEMFADLIRFREELGAALPEDSFKVILDSNCREDIIPGCFVVYEPNQTKKSSKYHFMSCSELKRICELGHAKTLRITNDISGLFRMYDGSVKRLPVCKTCLKEAKLRAETFSIREFFRERNYEAQIEKDIPAQIWMGAIEGIYRNDRYSKR